MLLGETAVAATHGKLHEAVIVELLYFVPTAHTPRVGGGHFKHTDTGLV